jgi:hypothetical protein
MVDLDFTRLCKHLQANDAETKKKYWRSLPARHEVQRFTREEIRTLEDLVLAEKDQDLRAYAILSLSAVYALGGIAAGEKPTEKSSEKLSDWLFEPFSHVRKDARAGTQSSLVLSVCDNQYIRDVQAQVEIARLLPSDRYPQTKFRHVPHEHPDWGDAGLDQAQGVCFIGRPLMFRNCRIIEQFPADLRFSIVSPPETGERADRSHVLPETGERTDFFCVTQNRPKAGPLRYNTVEQGANRHDYAIVQRFTIRFGGRDVVVLVIAGASGLGTIGAARWIASFDWTRKSREGFARKAGLETLDRSTRFEALLEVSGLVHKPARPWSPTPVVKSLFLHRSRNLLKAPSRVALATDSGLLTHAGEVRYLLFDDDEMDFSPKDNAAVVAVCAKCFLESRTEIPIEELISDARAWPDNNYRPTRDKAASFFRDHLQRHGLNITVSADSVKLPAGCRIETILAAPST